MHVEGPQIYQMNRQNLTVRFIAFRICVTCYRQKLTIWPGKSILYFFAKKNTSKSPILLDTNLGYLTLEGPGRQMVDTRSTSRLPLKTWGYGSSNYLPILNPVRNWQHELKPCHKSLIFVRPKSDHCLPLSQSNCFIR